MNQGQVTEKLKESNEANGHELSAFPLHCRKIIKKKKMKQHGDEFIYNSS